MKQVNVTASSEAADMSKDSMYALPLHPVNVPVAPGVLSNVKATSVPANA